MSEHTDPDPWAAGYALGRRVGFQLGWAAARRAAGNAIAEACAGMPRSAERVVHRLIKSWDRPAARNEKHVSHSRPSDWPGVDAMSPEQRREAYRVLIDSWSS